MVLIDKAQALKFEAHGVLSIKPSDNVRRLAIGLHGKLDTYKKRPRETNGRPGWFQITPSSKLRFNPAVDLEIAELGQCAWSIAKQLGTEKLPEPNWFQLAFQEKTEAFALGRGHIDGGIYKAGQVLTRHTMIVAVQLVGLCEPQQGATMYRPRSHTEIATFAKSAAYRDWATGRIHSEVECGDAFEPMLGEPGTVHVMHYLVRHDSHPNTRGPERAILFFRFDNPGHPTIAFGENQNDAYFDLWHDFPNLKQLLGAEISGG